MENSTSGETYSISVETDAGERVHITGGFAQVLLADRIPPAQTRSIHPTQAWTVVGNWRQAQLQSGLIATAEYRVHFYLTCDSLGHLYSASADPLNATYWVITPAGSDRRVYLELMNHEGASMGFLASVGGHIALTDNPHSWTIDKVPKQE